MQDNIIQCIHISCFWAILEHGFQWFCGWWDFLVLLLAHKWNPFHIKAVICIVFHPCLRLLLSLLYFHSLEKRGFRWRMKRFVFLGLRPISFCFCFHCDCVHKAIDWKAECTLDPSIRPEWDLTDLQPISMQGSVSVLLTGAAGFLGAHILRRLLMVLPNCKVTCIIRQGEHMMQWNLTLTKDNHTLTSVNLTKSEHNLTLAKDNHTLIN